MHKRRETMMSPKNRSILSIVLVSVLGLVFVPGLSASSQTQDLPEDPYERGMVLLKQFKYSEAKTSFDQVISQNPDHLNALYFRGRSQVAIDQLDSAQADFERALQINDQFAPAYVGKAMVATGRKDYESAMQHIAMAQSLEPENAEAFYQKGVVFGFQGKTDEAINSLKSCLEFQSDHVYAHYFIGLAYNQLRRMDLAVEHLDKFLFLAPEAPEAEQVRRLLSALR